MAFNPAMALQIAQTGSNILGSGLFGLGGTKNTKPTSGFGSTKRDINGISTGLGTVSADRVPGSNNDFALNVNLARPYQLGVNNTLDFSQQLYDELGNFNQDQFAQNFIDHLKQLAAPDEQQQRLDLENRLFQQGMLGSTGGYLRSRALEYALSQKALEREITGEQEAFNRRMGLFQGAMTGLNSAFDLQNTASTNLINAINQTAGRSVAGYQATSPDPTTLYNNRIDTYSGLLSGIGSGLQGLFKQPYAQSATPNQPYSMMGGW